MVKELSDRPTKAVLLIENDAEEARLIGEMFGHQGPYSFTLTRAESMGAAQGHLAVRSIDVVLLDLDCSDAPGMAAIMRIQAVARGASIVLLASPANEAIAQHAMEGGVQDYLIKGQIEPRELMRALRNSVARKILEENLFNEMNRAQITLNSIGDGVICTDETGNITFLNPTAEKMTGWSMKEATGRPLTQSFRITDASTGLIAANPTTNAVEPGRSSHLPVNCILTRRDGQQLYIEDSVASLRDSSGLPAGSVLVFRDVTVARALANQILHQAEHDPLTGLPNRLLMNDRLGQAISVAGRESSLVAVLYLDLDNFKHINDSLGHTAGDKFLQSVAARLQECVRAPDTVSRQGGDEFVLLIPDLHHAEDAAIMARRVLKVVEEAHSIEHHDLRVTACMGISIYPDDGLDAETLLKNADTAMFHAKENGRQNFKFFEKEMDMNSVERQSMEEDLRCALERNEFSLHYQPIVDLKSGSITGAEALLRWTHPTRGSVAPTTFLPVAEDTGLIVPIGEWVLREACTQAKAWADAGLHPIAISVNVSALQLRSEGFLDSLSAILKETGLNPTLLDIEVTESTLTQRYKAGAPTLNLLREKGVQVAVDDFGTGFSSLGNLQKHKVDSLKIDQSFVSEITTAPDDTSLVNAIISMGRSLGLRVIAEGVESPEALAFLKAQDCDEAQGYLFGRPVPADQFAKLELMKMD
jgi:diguanylate cyclase (GGDEF)-like protein/PAS domain S-box-containing protein